MARSLYKHLADTQILPADIFDNLKSAQIAKPITGFYVAKFPLWKLGHLLDENWVDEDILNVAVELLYNHLASQRKSTPTFLFLPTTFILDSCHLFQQQPRIYSPEIQAIRTRLCSTSFESLGFISWSNNHYSAYFLKKTGKLEYGNSLGLPPSETVVNAWALSNVIDIDNPPTPIAVALQGAGGGEGSCGIAAFNFIECQANLSVRQWTSDVFRDQMLWDLIVYHHIAENTQMTSSLSHWSVRCIPELERNHLDTFCGYNDFNIFRPTVQINY